MGNAAPRQAKYEDLLKVPANRIAEIINGELITQPRPSSPHAMASSAIGGELFGTFQTSKRGPGGWVILDEPELHLRGNVLVPDLAGWRRERMPIMPDTPAFDLAPDWVCEVLSPSTEARDRVDKLPIYLREGCTHVWLVQPAGQTLEIYRLDGPTYRLVGTFSGNVTISPEPFDAVPFDLSALWAR